MKPEGPVFDSTWRKTCQVRQVNRRKVDEMIKEGHYLGKWPSRIVLVLGLFRGDKVLGVMTFSEVHVTLAERFGQETWELSRLFLLDKVPTNGETFFIGRALRFIKTLPTFPKILISFADPAHGHSGVIYRASNWTVAEHQSKNLFYYELGSKS